MKMINIKELTKKLDSMDHADRVRTMAQLGKNNAGSPELDAVLEKFADFDDYSHYLSLFAYAASRQEEKLIRAVDSQSLMVRNAAVSLFYCYQNSSHLEPLIFSTTPQTRKALLNKIKQYKKTK